MKTKMLITVNELKDFKSRDSIPFECPICTKTFHRSKNLVQRWLKGTHSISYCSHKCKNKQQTEKGTKTVICHNCNNSFIRCISELNKSSKFKFCSRKCSAIYWNSHKTHGYRRSKLEVWLETNLTKSYPNLEIHFNKISTINSELDIYIPSLKLAFELNGIFHYESIYSEEKLKRTQNNDGRKFQACLEKQIELCVINVSKIKYFKEKTSIPIFEIIKTIIDNKLNGAS